MHTLFELLSLPTLWPDSMKTSQGISEQTMDQENISHCLEMSLFFIRGTLPVSPLNCIQYKNPVYLEDDHISAGLAVAINKWRQIYRVLFILWRDCQINEL